MKKLTVGSCFSGIGGIELGLEATGGFETKWQVEIDPYASRVLARHWPDVARFRDVRECGAHNLEPVDLICGGFPCQDISNAGRRAGIGGERSGLWSEYARIVCELRPRFVLVENVAALLGRGLGRVVGDLAALGYDAEWDCLPASAFGAPHRRDRLFIVAYPQRPERGTWDAQRRHLAGANALHGQRQESPTDARTSGQVVAHADRSGLALVQRREAAIRTCAATDGRDWWATEPRVGRVADGVPSRVDRLRALGGAVVPQVSEWIGYRILEAEGS